MKMKSHGFMVNLSRARPTTQQLLVPLLAGLMPFALVCFGFVVSEAALRTDESGRTTSATLIAPPRSPAQAARRKRAAGSSSRRRTRRRKRAARSIVNSNSDPTSATVPVVGGVPAGEEAPAAGGAAPPSIKPPMARSGDGPVGSPASQRIVSAGVLNGRAVSLPRPPYPPVARAARASGTVVVQVMVGEDGNVISAKALSGHPLLQSAAVEAARQAKFTPFTLEGRPVKVTGTITYNFVL